MTTDLCFIISRSPREGHLGQETFDLVVSGGVFDRRISVLFTGAGLGHLADHRPPSGQKSLAKLWQSAELFGISRFLVPANEAEAYGRLHHSALHGQVEFLDESAMQALLQESREVMVL